MPNGGSRNLQGIPFSILIFDTFRICDSICNKERHSSWFISKCLRWPLDYKDFSAHVDQRGKSGGNDLSVIGCG